MPDQGAELPTQPEQKKHGIVDSVKRGLVEFWRRVGPESVIQDKMETLQAIHEAVGPGKAQDVLRLLDPVFKAGATVAGIGVTAGEITLGVITNSIVRRFTNWIPDSTGIMGGLLDGVGRVIASGGRDGVAEESTFAGYNGGRRVGEAIRTTLGEAAGVGVSAIGVVHKAAGVLEKHALRPLGVRVAQTVGRITRGWDAAPVEPKPVVA